MTASALKDSILSHLKYAIGKDADHATIYDWRVALSLATRDRIVINEIPKGTAVLIASTLHWYLLREFGGCPVRC